MYSSPTTFLPPHIHKNIGSLEDWESPAKIKYASLCNQHAHCLVPTFSLKVNEIRDHITGAWCQKSNMGK